LDLSTGAAVELAAAAVVDGAATARAGALGATADAALRAAATSFIGGQAVIRARAVKRASATVREVPALVRVGGARHERRATALSRRVRCGRAANVASPGTAAVDGAAAAVRQLRTTLARVEAAARARRAAGLVRLTHGVGGARAVHRTAGIADRRVAGAVAGG